MKGIETGNAQALLASQKRSQEMENQFKRVRELNDQIKDLTEKFEEERTQLNAKINTQAKAMAKLEADKAAEAVGGGPARGAGDAPHALLLDISRGKTLWDAPLGKITRVENQDRQVYINLGSAHGVKPEVTFNVFAAGVGNRPEKELKGTIEVLRVLDANTSLARITSLYDTEGREILLTDPTKGRAQRESDNALKEGDLLFNMFWGAHVAIAGNVEFAGQFSQSPAEQMRILASFIHHLERMGVIVDAYVDLTDGKVKGPGLTGRTRYLIRGFNLTDSRPLRNGGPKKEAMKKDNAADNGEEKVDEEKKDEAPLPGDGPDAERLRHFEASVVGLQKGAVEKGLFIISVENFLNVTGYRQPRSANALDYSGFRPSVITAGQGLRGLDLSTPPAPKAQQEEPPAP